MTNNNCTLLYGSKYTRTRQLSDDYYYLAGGREVRGRANNFKTSSFCKILILLWICHRLLGCKMSDIYLFDSEIACMQWGGEVWGRNYGSIHRPLKTNQFSARPLFASTFVVHKLRLHFMAENSDASSTYSESDLPGAPCQPSLFLFPMRH